MRPRSGRLGDSDFGRRSLTARRLVEVTLDGWDTHQNNFDGVKNLCGVLDPAWATLMADLKARGLLDSTLIVCMGEFGRTPKINKDAGRDHWSNAMSVLFAGCGTPGPS